jgi:mannosyltransferase OCH1-like enzyme
LKIRDPLTFRSLAPFRFLASVPISPWPLRLWAAKRCMVGGSLSRLDQRVIALDHTKKVSRSKAANALGPIWQYWEQGAENAPPIVERCLNSTEKYKGNRERIVVDDRTIRRYIDLPDHIWKKRHLMTQAHFSNFVRLSLLARYGGTWLDATIMLTQPIPKSVEECSFLMLRQTGNPRLTETWFIHARQGHRLVETVLEALSDYWKRYDKLHGYFMFSYHIEAAVLLHSPLRRDFLHMPQIGVGRPHALQRRFGEAFDENVHSQVANAIWLHKLSHKFVRPETDERLLWDAILEGWLM